MQLNFIHKRRIFMSFFVFMLIIGSILLTYIITKEHEEPVHLHCASCSP